MFYLMMRSIHFFIYGYVSGMIDERKEMFYLTMHSIHFLFTVIWC